MRMNMKCVYVLAAAMLTVGGSIYADDDDTTQTTATLSSDEQVFAGQLSDANSAAFSAMSPADRAMVMKLAQTSDPNTGSTLTPDQAVQQMVPATGSQDAKGCAVQ